MNRRKFLKSGAVGISAAPGLLLPDADRPAHAFSLGIATFTMREFSFDQMLDMCTRCGVRQIELKDLHLPLNSSEEIIKQVVTRCRQKGIEPYAAGVIYMKTKEAVDQAFEYAKTAGIRLIVAKPAKQLLQYVEEKVRRYDIRLAIHNHGPGDQSYPTALSAYEMIKHMDERMGLCIDIGHTMRMGMDPAQDLSDFSARIFDIHIKDVTAPAPEGRNCVIGKGVIDIRSFLKALIDTRYNGVLALEYEENASDPLPGIMESLGYVKGVQSTL